jgi:hypothetical protein
MPVSRNSQVVSKYTNNINTSAYLLSVIGYVYLGKQSTIDSTSRKNS